MPVLFVSHSSKDDALAGALEKWLGANGFTDLFVDHQHIVGGAKWREELRASVGACRVVVCLVTANWLTSNECFNEFRAAWYMGKRIIPLFLLPLMSELGEEARQRFREVASEDQGVDLSTCFKFDEGLDLEADQSVARRLKEGLRAVGALTRIGLDPEAFTVDRALCPMPFPGLASFGDDDADAALFYGRSPEIAEVLEELRKVRAERDLRPFVILGASGAGKSSLLMAGIIPRLRRESPAWLPLRAFRPGADPLLNFAEALARTLADFATVEAHGTIRDRLFAVWTNSERKDNVLTSAGHTALEAALETEGRRLRAAADRHGATILISVDQAEELARAGGDGAEAIADYLRAALASTASSWQLAFTIRTDSFPELQKHRRFQNLKARGYDLRAVPAFRVESVVEEPAKRYGVRIDPELVSALIADAPEEDALPLLAFALQRLWRRYAAAGAISKDNYHSVGGLKQLIEDAAERALRDFVADQDVPLPPGPPPPQRVVLAAATFVPALAQLNEHGAVIRRAAPWNSFSAEQQQLLLSFDRWRLVVRKASRPNGSTNGSARENTANDGGTVEVAHEALFREWMRLRNWLEPERARLEALRTLQLDALTWDRNGRDPAVLNHRDKRLAEATALSGIESYRRRLGLAEFDYLAECQRAEQLAQRQRRRVQALVAILFVGIVAGITAWWNQDRLTEWIYAERSVHALTLAQERALEPKDVFKECDDCPEMIVVRPGKLEMRIPSEEAAPGITFTIAKPFAVAKFEVTFAEWEACVADHGCNGYEPGDEAWGRDGRPVVNVGWNDAQSYVAWLARLTRKPYRLLSESEYEYAAKAGADTAYSWGETVGTNNGNCVGCGSKWDGKQTAPVGSFAPNSFGLYDMAGNVWEWLEDCYQDAEYKIPTDGAPLVSENCSSRVVHGGAWDYAAMFLENWYRGGRPLVLRSNDIGFRVGRTLGALMSE